MRGAWIWMVCLLCAALLINEIVVFAVNEIAPSTRIFFAKQDKFWPVPFDLTNVAFATFDMHYSWARVPEKQQAFEWCADITDEICALTRAKFPVVTAIHVFSRNKQQSVRFPLELAPNRGCHALVVLALQKKEPCVVEDSGFVESACVVVKPQSKVRIAGDAFLVVHTQLCRAWDL